jgi:ankyrin repeat protein
VEELVFRGCKIDQGIETGNATPLSMAASRANVKVMTMLLDGKADPNTVNASNDCVLNCAIQAGSLDAVKLLVERGAALTYAPEKSASPLSQAASQPDRAIFDYLIEVGGDQFESHDYETALDAAADAGNAEVFSDLLEHEYEQDALQSALFSAYWDNNWNIVQMLLDKHSGLDVDATFCELATGTEDQNELLKKVWAYADGSIGSEAINYSLYEATDKEKESTVRILLELCEADPNSALGDE